jgi:hypothetical protein
MKTENKFLEMLKRNKAKKMGQVVNKVEETIEVVEETKVEETKKVKKKKDAKV